MPPTSHFSFGIRHLSLVIPLPLLLLSCNHPATPPAPDPSQPISRVYDIRELLLPGPNPHYLSFDPTEHDLLSFDLSKITRGGTAVQPAPRPEPPVDLHRAAILNLIATIQATVAPDSWRDDGGTLGAICERNNSLIITQTRANQTAILNLLNQLREARTPRIDLDIQAFLVDAPTVAALHLPTSAAFPSGPADSPNDTPAVAILTAPEIAAFHKALQNVTPLADLRARLPNGARDRVGFVAAQRYTDYYRPDTDDHGHTTYTPVRPLVYTGLILELETSISADRRYVVAKVRPAAQALDHFETRPTDNTSAGRHLTTQEPILRSFHPAGPDHRALSGAPRITDITPDTMVSIPDGQVLLLEAGECTDPAAETPPAVTDHPSPPASTPIQNPKSEFKNPPAPHLLVLIRPKIDIHGECEFPTSTAPAGPNRRIEELLDAGLPGLLAEQQPLSEVLAAFSQSTGLPLRPDWPALARVGLTPQTRITLHTAHLTARSTLTILLRHAAPAAHVTYTLQKGTLVIHPQAQP